MSSSPSDVTLAVIRGKPCVVVVSPQIKEPEGCDFCLMERTLFVKVDGFDVGVFDTRASKWLYTAASAGIFYIAVFSGDDHIVKEFRLTDDQRREFSKMANYLTYLTHDLAS